MFGLSFPSIQAFCYEGDKPFDPPGLSYDEKLMYDLGSMMHYIYCEEYNDRPFEKRFPEASIGLDYLFAKPKHLK